MHRTTNDRPPNGGQLDYWVPDGNYRLAARSRAGEAAPVGTLEVSNGRGTWTGRVSSVGRPVAIELVDQSGEVVCRGRLV